MRIPSHFQRRLLVGALIAASLVALALPFSSTAADKPSPVAKAALTVSLTTPIRAEWAQRLTANGNIMAWQEAIVGAEANGLRLTEIHANVGDRVRKGQLLATLQNETLSAELEQVRASLAEAEASLAEASSNAERARKIEGKGALSAQQVAQYLTAEKTAQARFAALQAQFKSTRIRLSQTRIVAPDDGTITSRTATLGAVVQPGTELFRLIRQNRLEWRAELPAADLARIRPGMTAKVVTASKNTLKGKVRMVAPSVDAQTRNGLVYVDLLETSNALAGSFARGEIELAQSSVLTLPQGAVQLREGYSYVFRIGSDKRVIQTKVTTGQRQGDLIAVTSGLQAGTQVVASGVGFLSDGDLVRLTSAPQAK